MASNVAGTTTAEAMVSNVVDITTIVEATVSSVADITPATTTVAVIARERPIMIRMPSTA